MAISVRDLLGKTFPPQPFWIDEGLLQHGSMMIIGGPPKSYKSFILNTIIADAILGGPLFGAHSKHAGKTRPRFNCPGGARVLLFEQEIGEFDLQNRLRDLVNKMGPADADRFSDSLHIESCNHQLQLDSNDGKAKIDIIIGNVKPTIVIFDPIIEFHTGDENNAQEMTKVLRNIDNLREKHKFTTIISHHTKKPNDNGNHFGGADNSPDRLRGSSTVYGKGDAFLMLNVNNRDAGIVGVTSVLRRGRPVKPFWVCLNNDTLKFEWCGWKPPQKPKKSDGGNSDDDED